MILPSGGAAAHRFDAELEVQAALPPFGFERAYEGNFLATFVLGMAIGEAIARVEMGAVQ